MSNPRQVSPDVAEQERDGPRPNNANMAQDAAAQGQGAAAGNVRRDENSISFRHFLQPHSDVVPSPAPTCRSRSRGTQPGAVDLVDMAMALPDFVQDHLVVESLSNVDHPNSVGPPNAGPSAVDLNVLNEILPDFAPSQPSHPLPAHSTQPRRRNIPEEPIVVPEVHGAPAAGGSSALPDFLSDGPMQCTDTNASDNNVLTAASGNRSASRMIPSNSLTERNRTVDETSRSTSFDSSDNIRGEVERLRRELGDRNRRIAQLEGEIVRLRTNVSALESALREAEHSALEHNRSNNGSGDSVKPSTSSTVKVNGRLSDYEEIDAQAVREIAQSSETLISQLLQNINRLKGFSDSNKESKGSSSDSSGNASEKK